MKNSKSQSGFTLVEVLAAVGILTVAALALSTLIYQGYIQSTKNSMLSGADIFKRTISALVSNDEGWVKMIQSNSEMGSCLSGSSCPGPFNILNALPFDLYDAAGTLVYNGRNQTAGITAAGVPCTGFSYTVTNMNCPMRFELKWFALSGGVKPQVAVVATLVLSQDSKLKINSNHYSIGSCSAGFLNGSGQFVCQQINNFLLRTTY